MNGRKQLHLTTKVGKLVDRITFGQICILIVSVIVLSAVCYYWDSRRGSGLINLEQKRPTAGECLYFSIITFTSLGYGDIRPVGFSRTIASVEVLSGLVFLSVFVGKLASERSNALIRLIYTSDHQRRLSEYSDNISVLSEGIDHAYHDYDHKRLISLAGRASGTVRALKQYVVYQAHQGDLLDTSNKASLGNLYNQLNSLLVTTIEAAQLAAIPSSCEGRLMDLIEVIDTFAKSLSGLEKGVKAASVLRHISSQAGFHRRFLESKRRGEPVKWTQVTLITQNLIDAVRGKLPPKPWPRNNYKTIAGQLGIPNKIVQRCLDRIDPTWKTASTHTHAASGARSLDWEI